jgi:DinB family protein
LCVARKRRSIFISMTTATGTSTETSRIADQIRRAFDGDAWHGDPLSKILSGVTAEQAAAHPINGAHSVWELVLHAAGWTKVAAEAVDGKPMPGWPTPDPAVDFQDWPAVPKPTPEAWNAAVANLLAAGKSLADRVATFPDSRLTEIVPGRKYNFYYLFHGILQHSLYHGGQMAIVKRAAQAAH